MLVLQPLIPVVCVLVTAALAFERDPRPVLHFKASPWYHPPPHFWAPFRVSSKTEDIYQGTLRSAGGKASVGVYGNTGGRLPYKVFASFQGGGRLQFYGRFKSSLRPHMVPLRVVATRASGKASGTVWSSSRTT